MMKNLFFSTLLCVMSIANVCAQANLPTTNSSSYQMYNDIFVNGCGTTYVPENKIAPANYYNKRTGKDGTESMLPWSLNNGYGASCTENCITEALTCTDGKYIIPIQVTIFADNDGSNQAVTLALSDLQIQYYNDYACCKGMPISLQQIAPPRIINNTNLNTTITSSNSTTKVGSLDVPNVLNVYIGRTVNSSNGCNGFAFLPTGAGATDRSVMSGACYTNIANVCTDTQSATVFIHEIAHYLGLYHTHEPAEVSGGVFTGTATECPDGSNGCTSGDRVADTNADPNLSAGCVTRSGCTVTAITCTSPCATAYSIAALNTQANIMSYNNLSGCRQNFTACQKARMQDALVGGRTNLIYSPAIYFSSDIINNANSHLREICVGGAMPTFAPKANIYKVCTNAADASTGTNVPQCYSWYAAATGGAPIASGLTYTPTAGTGAGQIDNNTPGTYYIYLQDNNVYTSNPRVRVETVVLPRTGTGTAGASAITTPGTTCLQGSSNSNLLISTATPQLGTNNTVVGWWLTEAQAACNLYATPAAINAAITAATKITPPYATNPVAQAGRIYQATGTSKNNLNINVDCGLLNPASNYYLTPIVARTKPALPDITCSNVPQNNVSEANFNGTPGRYAILNANNLTSSNCSGTPYNPINAPTTFNLAITISGYTGTANAMNIYIGRISSTQLYFTNNNAGNGTYNLTQANFPAGYDINSGFEVFMSGAGNSSSMSAMTFTVSATYPGAPAVPFPTINLQDGAGSCADCTFGQPVCFRCDASLSALPVTMLSFDAKQQQSSIALTWQTTQEINSDYFLVEKSTDLIHFETIAKVKSSGNSNTKQNYFSTDENPKLGKNYYRLKQTDNDGKYEYSKIASVDYLGKNEITISPNPNNGNFIVIFGDNNTEQSIIKIFDAVGKLVHQTQTTANQAELQVNYLPNGTYQVQVLQGKSVKNTKFIKIN